MFNNLIRNIFLLFIIGAGLSAVVLTTPAVVPESLAKAQEILRYMNSSVDPCEDFYEFTCGNYGKHHSAENEKQAVFHLLREMQLSYGKKIIEILLSDDESDSVIDKNVKTAYRSCLDFPKYLENHTDTYKTLLEEEIGQMPALVASSGEWKKDEFDWLKTMANIKKKYGLDIIADCLVIPDFTNNSVNGLYLGEPELKYTTKAIYSDEEYKPLLDYYRLEVVTNLRAYLGVDYIKAYRTAREIVQFETAIAKAMPDTRILNHVDEIYTPTTLEVLHEKYLPQWNVSEHIILTFGSIPPFQVYINDVFFQHVLPLIARTPKRVVANYIHYRFFSKFLLEFPSQNSDKLTKAVCLGAMKPYLSKYFDNLLYRKFDLQEAEEGVLEMWQSIKSAFRDTLSSQRLNWQNVETRKVAMDKLNAMKLIIKSYEDNDFQKDLGELKVDNENFLNSLKALQAIKGNKGRSVIHEPPQHIDFSHIVSQTPAYAITENKIFVPVYVLQPFYVWSKAFPNAFNFAALGSILAHELLHGFDDNGREFDAHGNVHSWWDLESSAKYVDRAKCFTQQYKQYIYEGRHLPEIALQTENIADNGGIRLAFEAYLKWSSNVLDLEQLREQESFAGLEYNAKQLFFISNSYMWCSDTNPEYVARRADDLHTVEKFRVIGSLSNFEEFSKAFNCPEGSGMNRKNKCEIF